MQYNELVELLPLGDQGEMDLGLDSMYQLMALLDNPQDKTPMIHIAGTNGKGSTASFVSHILREAGFRVGMFTSPSLVEFNERIQVNGESISDEQILKQAHVIKEAVAGSDLHMSEFELFAAMAFLHFQQECDIAIVEVGLGGRLDATNVITEPLVTVITKIGLDHTQILGDTLEQIASEKAEIIKPNTPVILYPQENEQVEKVIYDKAASVSAEVFPVSLEDLSYTLTTDRVQDFVFKNVLYRIKLLEEHQIINATVALETIFVLQKSGMDLNSNVIDQGLAKTTWPARFEWLCEQPHVILDGSHNEDGLEAFKLNLRRYFPGNKKVAIVGFMADKTIDRPLQEVIQDFDIIFTVTPDSPRALDNQALKHKIETLSNEVGHNLVVHASDTLEDALNQAVSMVDLDGLIAIFGSFYFVGIMRQLILAGRNEAV